LHTPAPDARIATEIKRRLATGEEELISAEMVDRVIDVENKLLLWREHCGMSAKELADPTGLAAPYISQLETASERDPSRHSRRSPPHAVWISTTSLSCSQGPRPNDRAIN